MKRRLRPQSHHEAHAEMIAARLIEAVERHKRAKAEAEAAVTMQGTES